MSGPCKSPEQDACLRMPPLLQRVSKTAARADKSAILEAQDHRKTGENHDYSSYPQNQGDGSPFLPFEFKLPRIASLKSVQHIVRRKQMLEEAQEKLAHAFLSI